MIGDKRVSYSRRKYREERRSYFLAVRFRLALVLAGYVAVAAVLWAALDGYLLGIAQAAVGGALAVALTSLFHANTGAIWRIAGAWGEDNTTDVLRTAKRRRLIWGWVDGIEVDSGDVDHLVVLRTGDVVAIDSKWHAEIRDRRALERDARAAAAAARRASSVLRSLKQSPAVRPVVVLWGAAQTHVPDVAVVDGVPFVAGRDLLDWLEDRRADGVRRKRAREVIADLETFKRRVRPSRR